MKDIHLRKTAHLAASLDAQNRGLGADLSHIQLPYDALFETSLGDIDFSTQVAGIRLSFPLVFSSMTGGSTAAEAFNTALRSVAAEFGLGLGLGSMRAFLVDSAQLSSYGTGQVDMLFANLGIGQIIGKHYSAAEVSQAIKSLGCNGLYIHLNFLQEWIQPEGDRFLRSDYECLGDFISAIPYPVLIKEVGSGISEMTAKRLAGLAIAGIETATLGGSSWVRIEGSRSSTFSPSSIDALASIGVELTDSIKACRSVLGPRSLIASGGISDAVTLVKALALGASAVGIAQPLLKAFDAGGYKGLRDYVSELILVSKLIWQSTGSRSLSELHQCLSPKRVD